ncbi:ChuX/HutX family heme-like substrate-binding protein [Xinfangfangia sp. CPCC 101601]|uniref:ChuX/HutX family heme-like substrate-binding protein n=1 Tax=Pseudogemmobacter lacusdianii TaxID=3069608 RepID=A0ABU0W1S9_9RHOB|nr:ChuX/HutX family heme-like substrate-binding protein [Xinfangfangia sp. CPCC 101601]MDQ2067976.1 ChuX/HutX family heme-like substrate-binding protein [Xinfangfangia sp. CPCC 101601]
MAKLAPEQIRAARSENMKARARDFAMVQGITEADLVAAYVGQTATAIVADPDRLLPWVGKLGDVMALTRNAHCVHERRGTYLDYRTGAFAAMVLGPEIDLRVFGKHWVHAYAVEEPGENGPRRSLQVFDAAGDAVHKVWLNAESDHGPWADLLANMRLPEQSDRLTLTEPKPADPAKGEPDQAAGLRQAWDAMTDTHQFIGMTRDQGVNRLGAYRIAGAPYAERLDPKSVTLTLERAAEGQIPVMIFVGNMGCIQIHGGPIEKVMPMGPWINVMDPRFNLHLRTDRLAEVYRVWKPTRTGDVFSVEGFAADGELILQIFGYRKDTPAEPWNALVAELPALEEVQA